MSPSFVATLDSIKERGEKILVVGLGVTGVETARFLSGRGLQVVCTEREAEEKFREKSKFLQSIDELRKLGVEIKFGVDGEMIRPYLTGVALAVLSPGVPLESAIVGAITRAGIPYVSELELGVTLHGGPCVVVTGSNGKTTTVSLIHHILHSAGVPSFLCGNVGTPVLASEELSLPLEARRSVLVVEASSYQLEACTVLKPKVSVVLNISENHLERHGTIERYALAKAAAVRLQSSGDVTVLNGDDPVLKRLASSCKGEIIFFGKRDEKTQSSDRQSVSILSSSDVDRDEIVAVIRKDGTFHTETYDLKGAFLLGTHNHYNMAAAIAVCRALGVTQPQVQEALLSFKPLEHRLELVNECNGVLAINDSKSTTVAASKAAVQTVRTHYSGRAVVVMIGGLSKAGSWEPLLRYMASLPQGTPPVVCFGKDGPLLANHCSAFGLPSVVAGTMVEGIACAYKEAKSIGGIILLTPGCASFDEFTDFEHRGRVYKESILRLMREDEVHKEVAA